MYGCKSWTIKKAEHGKMDAFKLWYWRLLRVPWTARRSNESILKEINPEYSLEGLMLKFQYFGHLMWRADTLEKTLMLGNIESKRRRGWQRMRWLDSLSDSVDMNLSKLWEIVEDKGSCRAAVHGIENKSDTTERLNSSKQHQMDFQNGLFSCRYGHREICNLLVIIFIKISTMVSGVYILMSKAFATPM